MINAFCKRIFLLIMILGTGLLLGSCNKNNPKGDLSGGVYFDKTYIPVEGATIGVVELEAESGADGSYLVKNIDEGENTLNAEKTGFEDYSASIQIKEGPNRHDIGMISTTLAGRVFGYVLGERTRDPQTNLEVVLLNPDESLSNLKSTTDENGFFELNGAPHGFRTLLVRQGEDILVEEEFEIIDSDIEINFDLHEPLVDSRDGKEYTYLIIGKQVWMGENMNYVYMDGEGSWCYMDDPANCDHYGRMYNWETAMEACPDGWHLPDDDEWRELEMSLGMSELDAYRGGWRLSGNVGYKMKSSSGWENNGNGDNSSGLNIRPGAGRRVDGLYDLLGSNAGYWTSTESDEENAWGRGFSFDKDGIFRLYSLKSLSTSVRCIQD